MPNVGHTIIAIVGDPLLCNQLHAAAVATAQPPDHDFTLSGLLGGDPAVTMPCRWTELHQTHGEVILSVGINYDGDCLGAARKLSALHPALAFHSTFRGEGDPHELSAMGHVAGQTLYDIEFDGPVTLYDYPDLKRQGTIIRYHERSQWADLVARRSFGAGGLATLSRQPLPENGWHRVGQGECPDLFYQPGEGKEDGTALLVTDASITLLRDLNLFGGYRSSQVLSLDDVRSSFPEVADAVAADASLRALAVIKDAASSIAASQADVEDGFIHF